MARSGVNVSLRTDGLEEFRRKAKKVERRAAALAREIGELEELARQHGIGVVVTNTQYSDKTIDPGDIPIKGEDLTP